MFWRCDPYEEPGPPGTISDGIRILEEALGTILRGLAEAERLNREEPSPSDDPGIISVTQLSEPPLRRAQVSGAIDYRWERRRRTSRRAHLLRSISARPCHLAMSRRWTVTVGDKQCGRRGLRKPRLLLFE